MTVERIFLATDLDRTMLPNGAQPESPRARALFAKLAARESVVLAYVSGRSRSLIEEAIAEYDLPLPDFAVGDVGTTIYRVGAKAVWEALDDWAGCIASDWRGLGWSDVQALFADLSGLKLQDDRPDKQGDFKVSYYTAAIIDHKALVAELTRRGEAAGIAASYIWSVDEEREVGLLDILPRSATKLHAVQFLGQRLQMPEERSVFAGDSGNDLPVVTSGMQSVLVANTRAEVQEEARAMLSAKGLSDRLYVAKGNWHTLNGNYAAGVLEGLAHFLPEIEPWLM
ncbi:MAG: haloacid dehalogenase [Candidatus Andersenbacteria bacterium CG10_big_fil_rev_8_21_14_0_10_54_11]|uniref:Haloacid dehalogenase n=1 Tax=Candidatus Andersenbacteria bacterium CG10_big_fil_rev_8_21_14_0_10_54_11 TaxID=1974485 RepID=A0A2M6WZZ9_9BACT|nr:MAG: haloacid dehalogenase [Candidatus Andersenbacteria bacterium CG10_big_fil_rev_8_21_14_0_10_54_11]